VLFFDAGRREHICMLSPRPQCRESRLLRVRLPGGSGGHLKQRSRCVAYCVKTVVAAEGHPGAACEFEVPLGVDNILRGKGFE
jgi:hypothetical protein